MEVKLVDHMGSDLSVVNAARVSFAKEHKEFNDVADWKFSFEVHNLTFEGRFKTNMYF